MTTRSNNLSRVYRYEYHVNSDQSVTLHFQGNIDKARLIIGGAVIDVINISNVTSGQLNFLNGKPINRALSLYSQCTVDFESTDPTPPVITEVAAANNLIWDNIPGVVYLEDVVLTRNDIVRKNNVMLYQREGAYGFCCLRYC